MARGHHGGKIFTSNHIQLGDAVEIEGTLWVDVRPPTRREVLGPNRESGKNQTAQYREHTLGIDGIGKQRSGDGRMLNVNSEDGTIRKDAGEGWEWRTDLIALVYLLDRTGAVGLREVFKSDISFTVDAFTRAGRDHIESGTSRKDLYTPLHQKPCGFPRGSDHELGLGLCRAWQRPGSGDECHAGNLA